MSARTRQPQSTTPIFVLRLSLAEFQHGVLAVARSAGRLGIPVYAVRREPREPATRSRYVTGCVDLDHATSAEARLRIINGLAQRIGPCVLVPIDDEAAVFAADHAGELDPRFLFSRAPDGLARELASKRRLWELCGDHGIPRPESRFPATAEELSAYAEELGYPVVLKRSDPWLPSRDPHAPSVCIVRNPSELLAAYHRMESPVRPQILLQEYLPGDAKSVWMFNGYFNDDSQCLCWFTGRKLRQNRPRVGPASLGICQPNPGVAELALRLMTGLGYRGIIDMGFRHDVRDGSYKLLDVNPRLGSTFRLFVDRGGLDVLRTQYFDLTGQPVRPGAEADGRKWIAEAADLASTIRLARDHELSLVEWLRSLRGIDEAAWWAADDPVPFVSMCARLAPYAYSLVRRRNGAAGR